MRFILFLLPFLFSQVIAQVVFESNFEKALEKAQASNKLLFIEYYNPNCPVCMALEPFFEEKEMADFYNKHFINYKMNSFEMSESEQKFINAAGLKFKSVPFFLFFDGEGDFVHHSSTQKDLNYLIGIGRSALNSFTRSSGLAKKYEEGDRTIKTLYAYCTLLHLFEEDSLIRIVSNDLFDVFDKNELASKKSYMITKKCINHPENGFFKFWIERMELMKEVGGCEHGEHKEIMQYILINALQKDEFDDLSQLQLLKSYVIKSELSDNPDAYLWRQEARLLAENGKETEAFNLIMKIADEGRKNVAAVMYPIEQGFAILKHSSHWKGLNMKLDQLSIDNVSAREQIKWNYLKFLFYEKMDDVEKMEIHIKAIQSIAKEEGFPIVEVNKFLKREVLK
jgi:thiol-disulfide isomerase/thioredoxin